MVDVLVILVNIFQISDIRGKMVNNNKSVLVSQNKLTSRTH